MCICAHAFIYSGYVMPIVHNIMYVYVSVYTCISTCGALNQPSVCTPIRLRPRLGGTGSGLMCSGDCVSRAVARSCGARFWIDVHFYKARHTWNVMGFAERIHGTTTITQSKCKVKSSVYI